LNTPPVALTVSGSDSCGGAGLQADLRCFAALGVHGTCALSAVTAQNTAAVLAIHRVPPEVVDAQIAAVVADLAPKATKTGMLASIEIMAVVAAHAARGAFPFLVVDPVMSASTGTDLLDMDARGAYLHLLFPWASVVTPNMAEAGLLLGRPITSLEEMAEAARQLHRSGSRVVVITGGHLQEGPDAIDVVFDGRNLTQLCAPRIETTNLHGTGCSFSAAITAHLALGVAPLEAIAAAKSYVTTAIQGARTWSLGAGAGPLDQLGWSRP
jgi:hydroxymethylpyrimidine/phosphomethylpyrimidine kinase